MIQHKCKIGQTVYLRSGGPEMTVRRLTSDACGNPSVETIWFAAVATNSGRALFWKTG